MKLGWKGLLGIGISVALLFYTLRGVAFHEVIAVLKESNVFLLILSAVVATLVFPLRAARWRVILEPVADVPFGPSWRAVAIGMMVNNVAPARAGEPARAFALSREVPQVPFSAALASLVVDRIIDAVVVVGLLVVGIVASGQSAATEVMAGWTLSRLAWLAGAMAGGALAVLVLVAFVPSLVTRVFDAIVRPIAPQFHTKARRFVDQMIAGMSALRSPSRFARILFWAVALWLTNAAAFYIGFRGMGIDAPLGAALVVQGLIAVGVAAPSSPGFVGVFEYFAKVGLALYAVPDDRAVSWGLAFHFLSFFPITLIGLYYFGRLGMHFGDLGAKPAQPSTPA